MAASSIRAVEFVSRRTIARDTHLLTFAARVRVQPTQFVLLDAFPVRFLMRPFAIAGYDPRAGRLSVLVRVVGDGSALLAGLRPGDAVRMAGPFGNTAPLRSIRYAARHGRVVLVAGGSGVAGIPFLYRYLRLNGGAVTVVYGECTAAAMVDLRRLGVPAPVYVTDDGTCGVRGVATDCVLRELERGDVAAVFACGPRPMLHALSSVMGDLRHRGIECWGSLEEFMCCGRGVCRSCVVPLRNASGHTVMATVCSDGPVFRLSAVQRVHFTHTTPTEPTEGRR